MQITQRGLSITFSCNDNTSIINRVKFRDKNQFIRDEMSIPFLLLKIRIWLGFNGQMFGRYCL
jgi:hypothetical protein